MLKVNKKSEPQSFQQLKNNPKIRKWDDFYQAENKELRDHLRQVRKYMLDYEQLYNGTCLCPYCERKVKLENSHIEHIKPRGKFQKLTFVYNNLIVSCNAPDTCGQYKNNKWKNTFINPVEENPTPYFHYSANGKIKEDNEYNNEKDKVKDTVSILNLNHSSLVDIRRTLFQQLNRYPKEYIESADKFFSDFPSFIRYYQKNYK